MMKKRLLLCALAASVIITSALCLNACKKNSDGDTVPTELTVMRGANHYAQCAHCDSLLWDRNYWGPIVGWYNDSVFHVHEYQINQPCALTLHGGYCRYDSLHHRHEVYYLVDPNNGYDHYQDDWIHIGGGGGGE